MTDLGPFPKIKLCAMQGCPKFITEDGLYCISHEPRKGCSYPNCTAIATSVDRLRCKTHEGVPIRLDVGKQRWELLAWGPLSEVVNVYTYGARKYPEESWRKGYKFRATFAALMRHAVAWMCGQQRDPESGCHHLAHVAWNCLTLMEYELLGRAELDDRAQSVAQIQPTSGIKDPPTKETSK